MITFSFVIQYVENPAASAEFYAGLLGLRAIETSPTFAMLALREGVMLGLWLRSGVVPPAGHGGGAAGEIAFTVDSRAEVERLHADWTARGLRVTLPPTALDFGYTFVAADPDGNRLRVFVPQG